MADNLLTVLDAEGDIQILRSVGLADGSQAQVVLYSESTEKVPDLTGAALGLIAVTTSAAVALDPPNAGARKCWVRAWEDGFQTDVRLFYRRDGTAPTASGNNCEGYLMHTEGRAITLATLTNFKMIAETGSAWHVTCEYTNT
jgi:hypothetical protein